MERVHPRLPITREELAALCQRWKIREFALFGSAVCDDFRDDSDIDVMVEFEPKAGWDLFDFSRLTRELEELFGRKVDVVTKASVTNSDRREAINRDRTVVYAA